jgi:hypothetical protein
MPLNGTDIESQTGAAQGLWTHTPVDYGGNEGVAKPGVFPANASQGYLGQGGGTRPGGAVTQTPSAAGAPKILSTQITNVTTTGFGVAVVFDAIVTSSRINYGTTQAVASNAAGTTAAAQTISASGLTTGTLYWYSVQATNAQGTTVSNLLSVRTF